jgi:glycerophosphoryl diester phosphodiesterase
MRRAVTALGALARASLGMRRDVMHGWGRRAAVVLVGMLMVTDGGAGGPAVQVAAHRGGALLWPENSLAAFRGALGLGVDYLELDVHLTADGEVVVIHDPTLERTTTATGPVAAIPLADLAAARLRGRDGAVTGEPVPTLAHVLDLLRPATAQVLLEIKVDAARRPYAGIEEKALALVTARGLRDRTIVMAFEAPTVRRIRALDPGVRTALLVSRARVEREGAAPETVVGWARDVGASHLGVDHRALDAGLVAAAGRAGLRVAAWTVNEEADIRRVLGLGVDVVISDQPDLALRLAGRGVPKP